MADPEGVKMNADFRPDWPDCGASKCDAETAAGWLRDLTRGWEWDATPSGSHLRRGSLANQQE